MKVLVAEDSPATLRLLADTLANLGHECITATDGNAALEAFLEEGPDVVIADWVMPGIEGDELCRRIRELDVPYPYLVILTSFDDKGHLLKAMEAGADDYLTKPVDSDDLAARLVAAARVTDVYRNLERHQEELRMLTGELREQGRRDALTGLGNRLLLREDLEVIDARAGRYGHSFAFVLCDLDRFKAYNDSLGHAAGDEALKAVADAMVGARREGDSVYRYGGEEILVLLPEQDLEGAERAAERLRAAVEGLGLEHPGADPGKVLTLSAGVAVLEEAETAEDAIRRADAALYEAKRAGRNRVVSA